jgi:predicted PurR-regulated permease PerM
MKFVVSARGRNEEKISTPYDALPGHIVDSALPDKTVPEPVNDHSVDETGWKDMYHCMTRYRSMEIPEKGAGVVLPLLIIALLFIIITGIKTTEFIANLLVISIILTLLALPAMEWLKKKGLPDIAAVTIVTGIAGACILVLIVLAAYSFNVLVTDLPVYQTELNERVAGISSFLGSLGISKNMELPSSLNLEAIASVIVSSVLSISNAIMTLFLITVTTFFMLLEAPHLKSRAEKMFAHEPEKLAQFSRMSKYIMDFIVVRTETNIVHGVLFGGILSIMGVHAAVLWGILTFVLGYIPYIGLVIAAIPAIFFAWLQFGTWGTIAVIAVVCVLNLIVENPVFSYFASRKFEMPAIIVMISVIFWGWLLGITGMLFAIPVTLMFLIVFQCSDDLRKINVLLGVSHLFEADAGSTGKAGGTQESEKNP